MCSPLGVKGQAASWSCAMSLESCPEWEPLSQIAAHYRTACRSSGSGGDSSQIPALEPHGRPLLGVWACENCCFEGSAKASRKGAGALLKGAACGPAGQPGHPIPHMGWAPLIPSVPKVPPLLPSMSAAPALGWYLSVHSYAAATTEEPAALRPTVVFWRRAVTAAVCRTSWRLPSFPPGGKSGPVGQECLGRGCAGWNAAETLALSSAAGANASPPGSTARPRRARVRAWREKPWLLLTLAVAEMAGSLACGSGVIGL